MFKKSNKKPQLDFFASVPSMLESSASKQYSDQSYWHNQFREQVLMRIDETVFKKLFSEKMGAPNASIQIMVGMMILKEGHGWSDIQLFENGRFNLLTRSALGLFNVNDPLPAESTYYLLRKRIYDHQKATGEDLLALTFEHITREQIKEFDVSGRSIRMDSKLIGSNIAYFSRYEIIHHSFCRYYKGLSESVKMTLADSDREQLDTILKEESTKTVYRSTKEEIKSRMQQLGTLIYKVLKLIPGNESEPFQTLQRVFQEQYKVEQDHQIVLRPKEEISSQSVQSPYDTDCSYRNKHDKPVKGYSVNITETCDDDSLNLITDVQVEIASAADNQFVVPAIEQTRQLLEHQVENCHTDGAYNSKENVDYCIEEDINFYLTGLQGAPSRYDLIPTQDGLLVTDTLTNEIIPSLKSKGNKWRINTVTGYRYFTQDAIDSCLLRKKISQYPLEIQNKRCNVEASIFQLCFHSRNNKTRYRGIIKHDMWAFFRCLWINLIRIVNFMEKVCQRTSEKAVESALLTIFTQLVTIQGNFGRKLKELLDNFSTSAAFMDLSKYLRFC